MAIMGRVKARVRERAKTGTTIPTMATVVMGKAKERETYLDEVGRDRIMMRMMPTIVREKVKVKVVKEMM